MYLRISFIFSLFFFAVKSNAQSYLESGKDLKKEITFGFNSNTNGGLVSGFNVRFTNQTEEKKYDLFSLEFVNVRSPLEERFSANNSSSFILGKVNYLIPFRFSYGKEIYLFGKYAENGVRLNFAYSAGPTIGFLKPYMIQYPAISASGLPYVALVPYDPKIHSENQIQGDAGILSGFGLSKINMGAHARTSLNFEYGSGDYFVVGIETGATYEAFIKRNTIVYTDTRKFFYSAFFVHLYYGLNF